jgi:hypothetical protein
LKGKPILCKHCECARPKLVLLEDPPRQPGCPNHAYVRMLRAMLTAANEEWRNATGTKLTTPAPKHWLYL